MLTPMTEKEEKAIVKSAIACINKKNVELLTKKAYIFISLSSGFIAHYNHGGFKDHYKDTAWLRCTLLKNKSQNQWDNFHSGENDYEYMMQKKKIYNAICDGI